MADFDADMLKLLKGVKSFQTTPVQEIWHNDEDQVLAFQRKDLIFVFNFNPNGTGRSLITGVKHLITLRALNLYARVATNVRNSISVTQVNVKLGENERNPIS